MIVDQYQCVKTDYKYLRSIGDLKCQNLSLVCSVVGRHLGCPRCTVIGTQCMKTDT